MKQKTITTDKATLFVFKNRTGRQYIDNNDGTASIPLNNGMYSMVDIEDVNLLTNHSWSLSNDGYVVSGIVRDGKQITIRMHRLILKDVPEDKDVDHVDMDKLNNRKYNLRVASKAENQRNVGIRKDNTSGFKGVSYEKSTGKYKAYIRLNGKMKNLGRFSCPIQASEAYDKAAKELFGDFARLNSQINTP